jgi:hypothetical protein
MAVSSKSPKLEWLLEQDDVLADGRSHMGSTRAMNIGGSLLLLFGILVAGPAAAEQKLFGSDPHGWDVFGFTAAIDGDTAIIGSHGYDVGVPDRGCAYIFEWDDLAGAWVETIMLTASDAGEDDYFGYDVAISGDIVVVGALYNDQSAADGGAAYVFSRNQGGADAWGEVEKLVASDGSVGDYFGHTGIAVGRGQLLVGAYGNDDQAGEAGAAYAFVIPIFADGLESGTTGCWDAVTP